MNPSIKLQGSEVSQKTIDEILPDSLFFFIVESLTSFEIINGFL
ncbi:MAG: hypothetical protein WA705_15640 [Candidatus Ozemobacteraceae bacterium]